MRFVGIDFGERRIGLAVSDPTGTLARPLRTIQRDRSDSAAIAALESAIGELHADDPISCIIVGLPTRLDGSESAQTARVRQLAALLGQRVPMPIAMQDERLSSHEAEERLAERERDWRKRKAKLDAAAAAVILQDYLDANVGEGRGER